MKRIDRETTQRILDTADIVEVVSDFVSLKKRGANYIGLCPFHNERTPSFSVSKAKGICKCFSCGKGGSPVNFIMEHEQMSYYEALKYLARKYHIEIKEYEMTDEERQRATERESLMAVNDFALEYFSNNLTATTDGRAIGLAYFRERGINDLMIKRFSLGYAPDRPDDLYAKAIGKGFEDKYLIDTGLCARSERTNQIYDRFRGRVIYPVFSVSGRPVAFGGRTLRNDKNVAKYVNSPESLIYHKSNEVYGIYQAKQAIVKSNKCILVEGYMDVISMHQVGVENVVASSGTSLTDGQIRLIHRFAENVTIIYDADPAGIKASLRGIDMLLAQGINIKVLLLPEGEDPDSFAQKHSGAEVEQYIADNETDFIRFKTRILLKDAHDDPIARARVINDILNSIAVIPDNILRAEYVKECSRMLDIKEDVLMLQLKKALSAHLMKKSGMSPANAETQPLSPSVISTPTQQSPVAAKQPQKPNSYTSNALLLDAERSLMKYVVKYGLVFLPGNEGEEPITVLDYVRSELSNDEISLANPIIHRIFDEVLNIAANSWPLDYSAFKEKADREYCEEMSKGEEEIRLNAVDLRDIQAKEKLLKERCDSDYLQKLDNYSSDYIENILLSSPDDEIRIATTDLVVEKHVLSKIHTRYSHVNSERERLIDLLPRAVLELKFAILNTRIDEIQAEIRSHSNDESVITLLEQQAKLYDIRRQFAKYLGERIVTPPK